jgi:N-glycosidase YbiA
MIDNIRGTFLSNFYECRLEYLGKTYRNAESAYQANKSNDPIVRNRFTNLTGREAKALGKRVVMREDWDKIKLRVMKDIVTAKFRNPELAMLLWNTGEQEIIESNTWNDKYWGVCDGKGSNHLGIILMEVRKELTEVQPAEQSASRFHRKGE